MTDRGATWVSNRLNGQELMGNILQVCSPYHYYYYNDDDDDYHRQYGSNRSLMIYLYHTLFRSVFIMVLLTITVQGVVRVI